METSLASYRLFPTGTEFIELAGRTNINMPYHAASRITLNAYRKPLNTARTALGRELHNERRGSQREPFPGHRHLFRKSGTRVAYHDPYISHLPEKKLSSVELTTTELTRADCVVVVTNHNTVDIGLVGSTRGSPPQPHTEEAQEATCQRGGALVLLFIYYLHGLRNVAALSFLITPKGATPTPWSVSPIPSREAVATWVPEGWPASARSSRTSAPRRT